MISVIALAAIVWLVNWFARYTISLSKDRASKIGKVFQGDRTRMLIVVTAVLFVIAIVGRILPSLGLGFGADTDSFGTWFALSLTGFVLFWAVALFWFPRSFVLPGKPIQKIVSLLLTIGVLVPFVINGIQSHVSSDDFALLISGIVYIFSVLGIGGGKLVDASEPEQAESGNASTVVRPFAVSRPSLFTVVPILLAVAAIAVHWVVDLEILVTPRPGVTTIAEKFELARESAIVKWNSGGRIQPRLWNQYGVIIWTVQFDEDSPADMLESLSGPRFNNIEFRDLKPGFDLSAIGGQSKIVKFTNCEFSGSQLTDILGAASGLQIEGDFSIVDDGSVIDPGMFANVEFINTSAGTITEFFKATKSEKQITYLIVNTPVSNKDWKKIEEVAQSAAVYLYRGLADDFQLPQKTLSLKQVQFLQTFNDELETKLSKELVLDTDIHFYSLGRYEDSPETAWKLTMLRGNNGIFSHYYYLSESQNAFAKRAKEIGMAYQLNDDQTIHSLFFPWGEGQTLNSLKHLKVLSFDSAWVGSQTARATTAPPTALGNLRNRPELEELYFDASLVPYDLAFLQGLKSLKHLQIPSVVRRATGNVGFDACQSLESITFLGTPDGQTYREITKLKNLKRLVIVNYDEDALLITPKYREKLKAKFPGVEVEILEITETESLVPQPFREYRDRVRKELREDTTWLDEALR